MNTSFPRVSATVIVIQSDALTIFLLTRTRNKSCLDDRGGEGSE